MCGLRSGRSQRRDAFSCIFERRAYSFARRSADHVMAINSGVQRNRGIEIIRELFAKLAQLFEGEVAEFYTLRNGEADRVSDLLVSFAKGNPLVNKVGSSRHRIEIASRRGNTHALEIETQRSS